jgi:hypothetical protein
MLGIIDSVKAIKDSIVGKKSAAALESPNSELVKVTLNTTYQVQDQNWYSAQPYGFKHNRRDGGQWIMFLPISPSNLTINTNFATNIVTTLYGTVEEHTEVRYYDISIEGTTGMSPKFVDPARSGNTSAMYQSLRKSGRKSFEINKGFKASDLGLFPKTLGLISKTINKAADVLDGGKKDAVAGFTNKESGYAAFHNLYRFLIEYKKSASGLNISTPYSKNTSPLIFFNYKDNNQYNVVVKNFVLRRSAENPMLYYYSIQMRGYALKTVEGPIPADDISKRLEDLGLNGVKTSSPFGEIKKTMGGVKSIVGAAKGSIDSLGR